MMMPSLPPFSEIVIESEETPRIAEMAQYLMSDDLQLQLPSDDDVDDDGAPIDVGILNISNTHGVYDQQVPSDEKSLQQQQQQQQQQSKVIQQHNQYNEFSLQKMTGGCEVPTTSPQHVQISIDSTTTFINMSPYRQNNAQSFLPAVDDASSSTQYLFHQYSGGDDDTNYQPNGCSNNDNTRSSPTRPHPYSPVQHLTQPAAAYRTRRETKSTSSRRSSIMSNDGGSSSEVDPDEAVASTSAGSSRRGRGRPRKTENNDKSVVYARNYRKKQAETIKKYKAMKPKYESLQLEYASLQKANKQLMSENNRLSEQIKQMVHSCKCKSITKFR